MSFRNKRVAEVIKEAVAKILLQELQDPNFRFVTVTQAKISPDLKNATIYLSILGNEDEQNRALEHLNRATGRIRHLLGKQVTLRYLPELTFAIDTILKEEEKIGEILNELYPHGSVQSEEPDKAKDGSSNSEE
jgi:ribosome-binding factor A